MDTARGGVRWRDRLRELRGVAAFTGTYLAAAAVATVAVGNLEFLFYLGVLLPLVAAVAAVDARVRLSRGALWGLSLWGLAHMAGGLVPAPAGWPVHGAGQPVLYSLWLIPGQIKYDQLVHAFGFGVTTLVCWQALASALRARGLRARPSAGLLLLCAAAGMGFGALNEVVEFVATLLVPETNVGGYRNTGWDLVANLLGATVAALWLGVAARRRQHG